jgi:phosphotransferase system HPr (HPr) family protein
MVKMDITLTNATGLHARPAAQFVHAANRYKDTIVKVSKNGKEIDAKSIISIMGLGATQGTVLTLIADGPDETEVIRVLADLVENGFGEGAEAGC